MKYVGEKISPVIFVLCFLFVLVLGNLNAQTNGWQPSQGHTQMPLWPKEPPDPQLVTGPELVTTSKELIAGSPVVTVERVSQPTMTIYSPKGQNTGVAVVVFPGGGYKILAMDLEGTEVCDWLTSKGITCVLLKYRVPNSGCHWDEKTRKHITPDVPTALQDAQRTISTIRYNSKKYNVDPNKIGVMGFSAGGNLAVLSSTAFKKRSYDPIDEIDKMSCRPDFAIPVYPGHMTMEHKNKTPKKVARKELNTDIVVSNEIPPTLLVHAKDDPVDPFYYSQVYEKALRKAGVNVKLDAYETGGHAFGVRKAGKDTDRWTDDVLVWLKQIKWP
ncbi:MAG: alpha/beta hydrolase [Candidatus Ozemobacteraceae bacterium]